MAQLSSGRFVAFLLSALMVGVLASSAGAQTPVTQADIQRLQDGISMATKDIAQARTRDAVLADQLQRELDDVRDQTTYLRVKLQRNEPIVRSDYAELRDRLDSISDRARGDGSGVGSAPAPPAVAGERPSVSRAPNEIAVGTEFDVRIQSALSSATSVPEQRFEATTLVDLQNEHGQVLVPAGSVMRGVVNSVTKATRTERTGKLVVAFDQVTIDHRTYPIHGTVTQAIESEGIKGEAAKIGVGAGVGAILGAIIGGGKGALAGILIGGGGTIVATEGKDVELPAGTVLRVRMDSPLTVER